MNQQVYDMMIVLFMAGAMFGAFNLSSRIVEAQRRQIGIGMALGMSPRALADTARCWSARRSPFWARSLGW